MDEIIRDYNVFLDFSENIAECGKGIWGGGEAAFLYSVEQAKRVDDECQYELNEWNGVDTQRQKEGRKWKVLLIIDNILW